MYALPLFYVQFLLTPLSVILLIHFFLSVQMYFALELRNVSSLMEAPFSSYPTEIIKLKGQPSTKDEQMIQIFILPATRYSWLTPPRNQSLCWFIKSRDSAAIFPKSLFDFGFTVSCVHTFCLLHFSLASGFFLLSDILMLHFLAAVLPE